MLLSHVTNKMSQIKCLRNLHVYKKIIVDMKQVLDEFLTWLHFCQIQDFTRALVRPETLSCFQTVLTMGLKLFLIGTQSSG